MPGLFPSTGVGKQAAQRCCEEGLLAPLETSVATGRCAITDKGMAYLYGQVSSRPVLEDCLRVLEEREAHLTQLVQAVKQMQAGCESLRSVIAGVVTRMTSPGGDLKSLLATFHDDKPTEDGTDPAPALVQVLTRWAQGSAQDDCPLPQLYRQAGLEPGSLGRFHDALRKLLEAGTIYLHPWTGPLYAIPEPPFALLVGHEIAYYASLRRKDEG
jgi:hypothetical protein